MKRLLFTILFSIAILSSCTEEMVKGGTLIDGWKEYPIEISSDGSPFNLSKSSFPAKCLDMISNLSIAIYNNGNLIRSDYFTDMGSLALKFPDEDLPYDIFFLANCGEVNAPVSEKAMKDFTCRYPDYGSFKDNGFPMSLVCTDFIPGSSSKFFLKRLVGEYDLTFSNGSSRADYAVKSVRLCNCAADVKAFSDESRTETAFNDGDYLTDADIADLNGGKPVSLYFLENMQGVLLPGNTDPKKKIPSTIGDPSVSNLCTYLLVVAEAVTPTAKYNRIFCRCYLGGDMTGDFNIKRNTRYELNLDFESDFISEEEWRLEPDMPEITGSIRTDKSGIKLFYGYDGPDNDVSISVPEGAEYTVSFDYGQNQEAKVSFTTTAPEREENNRRIFTGDGEFHFETLLQPDGCLPSDGTPDIKYVTVTIATTDGLLTEHLSVGVYHELFPIHLEYINDILKMKVYNPFSKQFSTTVSGEVSGSGVSQQSQIKGEKRENCSEYIANVSKTFTPSSGQYVDIDNSSFHNACHKIRFNHDVWYDHTWLGTSGNWRHSYPTAFRLGIEIMSDGHRLDICNPFESGEMFWLDNLPNMTAEETDGRTFVVLLWPAYIWNRAKAWDVDIITKIAELKADENYMICGNDYHMLHEPYIRILPSGLDVKCHFIDELGNYWDFHSENTDDFYEYYFLCGRGNQNYNRTLSVEVNGCCDWFWNFRGHKENVW